jgi:hypothetical protein
LGTERNLVQEAWKTLGAKLQELTIANADLQRRMLVTHIPGLLITTMPRSATYYISDVLAKGLAIDPIIVANQYFPYDTIRYFELKRLAQGHAIAQDHFDASPINLTFIRNFFDRMVVHTRDPRQAMLSWLHFVSTFDRKNPDTRTFIYPTLPVDFFDLSLSAKIDWGIANWLPLLVEWTERWVKAAATERHVKIKITRYEHFWADQANFIVDLLHFFAIVPERFQPVVIARDEAHHFRKGEVDEWRRVLTPRQIAEANRRIPRSLAQEMGWPLDA